MNRRTVSEIDLSLTPLLYSIKRNTIL